MVMTTRNPQHWNPVAVADRFKEATETAQRLPPAKVQGYFNTWPKIIRESWETFGEEKIPTCVPPDPNAIDRMLETMRWLLWLDETERHLILGRVTRKSRSQSAIRQGISRTTLWRKWRAALQEVADRLNGAGARNNVKERICEY